MIVNESAVEWADDRTGPKDVSVAFRKMKKKNGLFHQQEKYFAYPFDKITCQEKGKYQE